MQNTLWLQVNNGMVVKARNSTYWQERVSNGKFYLMIITSKKAQVNIYIPGWISEFFEWATHYSDLGQSDAGGCCPSNCPRTCIDQFMCHSQRLVKTGIICKTGLSKYPPVSSNSGKLLSTTIVWSSRESWCGVSHATSTADDKQQIYFAWP